MQPVADPYHRTMQNIAERWRATEAMPPERQEVERNVLAIMYDAERQSREKAIESSDNVVRLAPKRDAAPLEPPPAA